jgi:2'-5' RNA ligase
MGVRVLEPENWHLTLRFIGDVGDDAAKKIAGALAEVRFAPFTVRLRGAGAYPNTNFPRAIFIGGESAGAAELAEQIEQVLSPFGFKKEKFSVHLTVARSKGAGDIGEFVKHAGEVGEFEVRSFCLMKSRLLPQGASYEVLREYPAQG